MGKITLFYKYVNLSDPQAVMMWQRALCEKLNLTGRILIGTEGINGTVGGDERSIRCYVREMKQYAPFKNIDFKFSGCTNQPFEHLTVKVRKEIVALGINPQELTAQQGGKHLSPKQVHELLQNKPEDLVILDTRNACEVAIGKFEGAIDPKIEHFRDFPKYIEENLEQFKDKQVLMYCTGGIRCERASAVLKVKNVAKEVFQIKGGIHRYAQNYPNGFFRGKNYVFDNRIAMKVNNDILGQCYTCQKPYDEYTNCLNALCNKHYINCPTCIDNLSNTCSPKCQALVANKQTIIRPARPSNLANAQANKS
jgi:predicted sulfurtransferase